MRVSSKIVYFIPCSSPSDQSALPPAEDRVLQSIEHRRLAAETGFLLPQQRLLQREYALRTLEVVHTQAPVYGVQQLSGILARPALAGACHFVLFHALRSNRRSGSREAGIHRGADRIDVAPGAEFGALPVVLRRGKPRRIHRRQPQAIPRERLAAGPQTQPT